MQICVALGGEYNQVHHLHEEAHGKQSIKQDYQTRSRTQKSAPKADVSIAVRIRLDMTESVSRDIILVEKTHQSRAIP